MRLPKGWTKAELGTVCSKIGSGATPRGGRESYAPAGVPLIRSMNVHFAGFKQDGLVFLNESQARLLDGVKVEANDVLLNITGASIGRVCLTPKELSGARVNQHVCIIRPVNEVVPRYIALLLASPELQQFILNENYGFTRQALTKEMIEGISFPLPPLAEQRRIVENLDTLTARLARARAELGRVPHLAKNMRNAVLSMAFRGELTAAWRGENPSAMPVAPRANHELRAKYRGDGRTVNPYSVPQSWRWLRLPQIGHLDRGKSRHRPRNDPILFGGDHPFIQTGDVRSAGQYLTRFSEKYNDRGLAQSYKWSRGTVCITIAANIAESTILAIDACFPDSVVGFVPDDDRAVSEYIEYFIRTAKADLQRFAPATAQKNINLDTLSVVAVPIPPVEEQSEIVKEVQSVFARADRLEADAAQAQALLDRFEASILARAFSGELVPQDPTDEPASVLLERIRSGRAAAPTAKGKRGRKKADIAA